MAHTLVMVRTAFQAWFASRLLEQLQPSSYDVLQISYNKAPEERVQFDLIASNARNAWFVEGRHMRFDFLTQFDLWRMIPLEAVTTSYQALMLSSIDAPVIGAIASRHPSADLITWDDGLANIVPNGRYNTGALPWRANLVRKVLLAGSISSLKSRIGQHYTIFPDLPNIAPVSCTRTIIKNDQTERTELSSVGPSYFIGQPFEEALTPKGMAWLKDQVNVLAPDWYVRHPREKNPLIKDIPELNKCGQIAEQAVARHAAGRSIRLVGVFSTTLFSLADISASVTMLLPRVLKDREFIADLGQRSGFQLIRE